VNYNPVITGSGSLVQQGPGTLTLRGVNTYTGGTTIRNGSTLSLGTASAMGTGPANLAGGTLSSGAFTLANAINVTADSTINNVAGSQLHFNSSSFGGTGGTLTLVGGPIRLNAAGVTCDRPVVISGGLLQCYNRDGEQTFNGVISGPGVFQRRWPDGNPLNSGAVVLNAANTYSGGTLLREGSIGFGADSEGSPGSVTAGPIGTGSLNQDNATYTAVFAAGGPRTVGNPIMLNPAGQALIIKGSLDLTLSGPINLGGGTKSLQVENTAQTILSGEVSGGSLVKTGNGTLYLDGVDSASLTTVRAGALGGTGLISGPVIVETDGALAPGHSIGTLTINNSLSLAGRTVMELNAAQQTSDRVAGLSSVSYGGTLQLTNLGGTFANGQSFQIFSALSYSGVFSSVVPPTPGPGQTWNTDNLALDGTISVVGNPVVQPTLTGTTRLSNGTVQFSFSGASGQSYRVWATTNVGLTPVPNTWVLLTNAVVGTGPVVFTDAQASNFSQRFYVVTVP
jgi:autotransporter-associated beta strand protein